jgi:lipoprotein-releasing system ATP-binding protein|tara:strand:- start:350 stop:1042 length:693 start_codon:yes stop_codon:yes gene_type:complete
MNREIIKLLKISKKYQDTGKKVSVLNEINLTIKSGELISLTGPSGSGKSTLLHIIALLDKPSSGEVFFKKKSFTKSNEKEKDLVRKKGISIIYQQNNLLSDFTSLENVAIPLLNNGYSWNESKKKAAKMLSLVNLHKRLNHFPSELSGGEQQRVAVGRALVTEPDLILADEPTGSLDRETANDIFSLFTKLRSKNRTILYATHNRELSNKADYKLNIIDGNILRDNEFSF